MREFIVKRHLKDSIPVGQIAVHINRIKNNPFFYPWRFYQIKNGIRCTDIICAIAIKKQIFTKDLWSVHTPTFQKFIHHKQ